jgi:hypothetical protein
VIALALFALFADALAAPLRVDVLLSPAVLQTPRITAAHEGVDVFGAPTDLRRRPDQQPLGGQGLGIALLADQDASMWFVEVLTRVTVPRYEFRNWTFTPVATSVRLDGGALVWFDGVGDRPAVAGYGVLAGGLQLSLLGARPFVTAVAPAVHGSTSLGVGSHGEKLRFRAEFRGDLALRVDHLAGRAERPQGAFTWSWWPGEAALSLVVGIGLPAGGAG